ncbi:hypothetical protein OG948_60390 (plasmid) [Embleya sp. NBC_00888]|uniref:hypothetical protein n=1 Tax=Embleya sp. NBC_00888 TaxID=2975960 RepID=UPI002F9179F9|nr:hypothetical protein OG948_60390 [Embleya sp. NBC_00888]
MHEELPERLRHLLDLQVDVERADLACRKAAGRDDTRALNQGRAARLDAMRALITARAAAGADSAPDRDLLKTAALAVLAAERGNAHNRA